MGSLTSTPNIPKTKAKPQVVYVPVTQSYTPAAQPVTQTPAPADGNTSGSADTTQGAAQRREQSLLTRGRGIFGTVQTSFRGILDLAAGGGNGRKTLLGE